MKLHFFHHFFWPLFWAALSLSLVGIAFVYSASFNIEAGHFAMKQLVWLSVGLALMSLIVAIGYKPFLNISYVLYVCGVVLLVFVLVFGHVRMGAQRWISVGPFILQPSEFIKIILIVTLAHYLGGQEKYLYQIQRFIVCFFLTLIPLILVLKQPDLGTALIFLPILFCILFVWGARIRFFLVTFSLGLVSLPFLWHLLKDYQKRRLLTFINPNMDPMGASYTAIQSKIAVGSGGLWGKGWMAGTQNKLDFLPEHHTDFIFGVVGEELGFLGSCLVLVLYGAFIYFALKVIRSTTDMRGRLLATGIVAMLAFHVLINMGMTIGLMPVTGLPLPFISYGGSSMIVFFMATGFLLSIYKERSIF